MTSPAVDSTSILVTLAAGVVLGTVPVLSPIESNNGGLLGTTVDHPSAGVYVIHLAYPADPLRTLVNVTPQPPGGVYWDVDLSMVGDVIDPRITLNLRLP